MNDFTEYSNDYADYSDYAANVPEESANLDYKAKIPPNDSEAEHAVLASMLFDSEAISTALDFLQGDSFYKPENKAIFEAIVALFNSQQPVDTVTLGNKLTEQGIYEQIGGFDYIRTLADASYTSTNAKFYSKIVADKYLLRRLIKAAAEISTDSYAAAEESEAILNRAEKAIFDLATSTKNADFEPIFDIVQISLDELEKRRKHKGNLTGLDTGFADLNRMTAGLQKSDLIIIGARPSMGKTAFLLNVAQHVSIKNQIPTAVFSLEMSKIQLVNRMLCVAANLELQKFRVGDVSDDDYNDIMDAMEEISNAKLFIDDTPSISVAELRSKCRRLKLENDLGLIVIDYLQLMSSSSSRPESRQIEISEISRELKSLAKELDVPILTAAQLSRGVEMRRDKRPMLSDLRESGAIEQDADIVAFLYRDKYYNPETENPNAAELIVGKQRNGPTGTVHLVYLEQYTRFRDAEEGEIPSYGE
ncbi:MAG: replicative DNA helicase [Defluviitaleaceae bacterium]|nr:replicative DNA helicase [Defluviitaleaceae bacterium]